MHGQIALQQQGGDAIFIKADVLSKDDLVNARNIILGKYKKINGLVNAAGGNIPEGIIQPGEDIFDINVEGLRKAFDLNLFGSILPVSVFGKDMMESGNGSIVNISSMAAQSALTRVLGYSLAKGAIDNYTKWMCVESAMRFGGKITVQCHSPGIFYYTPEPRTAYERRWLIY